MYCQFSGIIVICCSPFCRPFVSQKLTQVICTPTCALQNTPEGALITLTVPIHCIDFHKHLSVCQDEDEDDELEHNNVEYPSSQPSSMSNSSSPSRQPNGNENPVPSSSTPCVPQTHGHKKEDLQQAGPGGDCPDDPYLRLPAEPDSGSPDVCNVGVRLPDGRRVQRRFSKHNTLQVCCRDCAC